LWATTSIKKVKDVVKLQALIDRNKVVVTKDIIRQDLRLDDADGVDCLPTEEIFAELAGGRIKAIDADEEITLVDMETHDDLGAELQGRLEEKDEVNAGAKEVNAAKPTVFDDKEDTPTDDPKEMSKEDVQNMLQIIPRLVKEKFSTTMPTEDKEKALWVELKRLYEPNTAEKDYPLIDAVLLLMLSTKPQVDEDCEMARDLVMKIFMEANKPKSRKTRVDAVQRLQENTLTD
nr:hypothetical protein [Tanacetum cinerariifolium]